MIIIHGVPSSAASSGGIWFDIHVSAVAGSVSCPSSSLFGMMKLSLGSVRFAMSTARSVYGCSFRWFTLLKFVHGLWRRTYSAASHVHTSAPGFGRFSEYACHVIPAASHACPRFSVEKNVPVARQLSFVTPCVAPDHSAM